MLAIWKGLTLTLFLSHCCLYDGEERGIEWVCFSSYLIRCYSKGIWTLRITYSNNGWDIIWEYNINTNNLSYGVFATFLVIRNCFTVLDPSSGVHKLQPVGQILSMACFENKFYWNTVTSIHSRVVCGSFYATMVELSIIFETKIFSIWPFTEKFANPCFGWIKYTGGVAYLGYLPILIITFEKADKKMFTNCYTFRVFEHTIFF